MSFWGELKRRNVYKVGVAYAIVAWLLIQGAAIVSPALQLPKWTLSFVIVILIIGFPLILLFAWAFEITPEGIRRTKEVPLHESITHITGRKLNYIVTSLLVLAVAFIMFDKFYIDRRATLTEQVSVSGEAKVKKTIAVLPFVNMSSDPDQEYFADGLSEELINCLSKISDLSVYRKDIIFYIQGF